MPHIKPLKWSLGWGCLLLLASWSPNTSLGAPLSGIPTKGGALTRVVSVSAKVTKGETVIVVKGDGVIPEYICDTFADPPRIVIDLLCANKGFESKHIVLESPIVEKVRIGHHPDKIRLALDIKGSSLPAFLVEQQLASIRIRLFLDAQAAPEEAKGIQPTGKEKSGESAPRSRGEEKSVEPASIVASAGPLDDPEEKKRNKSSQEEILEVAEKDGQPDTMLFRGGVDAVRAQRWAEALNRFQTLLEKYPQGRYAERATLLLARSYEHLKESSVSTNFLDMKGYYEDFLSRFPSSKYGGDALVSMGRLCFQVGQQEEAMGYYGLAFSRDKNAPAAAAALAGKMKILMMKRRFDDALASAGYILEHFPHNGEALEARLDMAKILHEMNRFQESLAALSTLEKEDVRNVYLHPEISLYLGYDRYQLEDFSVARQDLFRFCNTSPQAEEAPFALTRIGDTYRDERRLDAASKVYRWVAEHYPDSEGSLISQIRLAELQEQDQERTLEKGLGFGGQPGEKIPSPKEVYETMLQSSKIKDQRSPLIALALLKLAALYQKEGAYEKSLTMVKELLQRFPGPRLEKEAELVLLRALEGIVTQSIQAKDYLRAIRFYYDEKDLFSRIDSPELYLAMARAFLKMNLTDDAVVLFKKAGAFLPEDEKPVDMLYFAAWDLHRQGRSDQALEKLNAVTEKRNDQEYTSQAYLLKGRIMAERMQWEDALEAFSIALTHSPGPCTKFQILTEKASAQAGSGRRDGALKTALEARALSADCGHPSPYAYEALSGVFSLLGSANEALAVLKEALGKEGEPQDQERLKWKLAQTYESLGKQKDSLAMYQDLSKRDNPLWKSLAEEKIEELRFRQEIDSFKSENRRKAQPAL